MPQREVGQRSFLWSLGRWSKTRGAFRLGLVVAAILLAFLAWARSRLHRAAEFEPTTTGEITVVAVVGGNQPTGSNAATGFSVLVRVASGRQLYTTVREPLPPGERLWAVYSMAKERSVMKLVSYERCGMRACSVNTAPDAPR
jgi:hypothetical protein